MSSTNFTVRMDENLKEQFHSLCDAIGLSMASAITVFAKTAVRERRIPFELSAATPNRDTIEAMLEAEKLSCDPNVKRYRNFREALNEVLADEQV